MVVNPVRTDYCDQARKLARITLTMATPVTADFIQHRQTSQRSNPSL